MREKVEGYCLNVNHAGVPVLEECQVERLTDTRFLKPNFVDGVLDTYSYLKFGVDFFYHYLPGLTELVKQLEAVRNEHRMAITHLEQQIEGVKQAIELEREKD